MKQPLSLSVKKNYLPTGKCRFEKSLPYKYRIEFMLYDY